MFVDGDRFTARSKNKSSQFKSARPLCRAEYAEAERRTVLRKRQSASHNGSKTSEESSHSAFKR